MVTALRTRRRRCGAQDGSSIELPTAVVAPWWYGPVRPRSQLAGNGRVSGAWVAHRDEGRCSLALHLSSRTQTTRAARAFPHQGGSVRPSPVLPSRCDSQDPPAAPPDRGGSTPMSNAASMLGCAIGAGTRFAPPRPPVPAALRRTSSAPTQPPPGGRAAAGALHARKVRAPYNHGAG